ncbi:MAG: hypothetical protein M3Y91_04610 [Actinomycetota bacterium]|nr:hypothetical protein [Actinomycetota bacterium]
MLALHIVLTLVVIVAFIGVLAYFLNRLATVLTNVALNLAKISDGVRAVEKQCEIIGPGADAVNANLAAAAAGLGQAAVLAEGMGGG